MATDGARAEPDRAVRPATPADREHIAGVLSRAFADDPAMTFIFPDPADRARRLPRLFRLLIDADIAVGRVLLTGGREAATLWRPPGHAHTGTLAMLRVLIPLLGAFGTALGRGMAVGNAIDAHFPKGAFWYLHIAGCDPAHQGRGLGGAAIRAGFDARVPTYLETPVEGYVPLYQRLGFTLTGDWRVPGGGPRFWSMWRDADASTGAPQPR